MMLLFASDYDSESFDGQTYWSNRLFVSRELKTNPPRRA